MGPDFHRPAAPADAGYAPTSLPLVTASATGVAGAAERLVPGRDVAFDWWKVYRCPPLDALVAAALRANPTIESAKSALRQAHALTKAAEGAFFPTLTTNIQPSRNLTPTGALSPASASGNPYYSLYTGQLSVAYSPDIFGATRRAVESQAAQEANQRFELEAAYVSLASNVVQAAITDASTRDQIVATKELIDFAVKALVILRNQQKYGYAMGIDAAAQEAALAQFMLTLPPLEKQLEQTRDQLRALVGNLPNQDVPVSCSLAMLHLPEDLPLSLPSAIIEHRPDVRAAEELIRAANANLGVAVSDLVPQVVLTANYGTAANTVGTLFGPGTLFWNLIANATQTVFDGGTLLNKRRAADEALIQAAAQYRSTVIGAFQNVADTLHALLSDADGLKAAVVADQAARVTLDLTQRQQQVGYVNYLTLLNAEQAYQTARIALVQAQASRLSDTAALSQALGGGWWNRQRLATGDETVRTARASTADDAGGH